VAAPKSVTILDALPVTAVGKPYKLGLRADAAQKALADALAVHGAQVAVTTEIDDGTVTARLTVSTEVDQAAVKAVVDAFTIPWKLEIKP
jgi:fatty-acyl-CoA synthase